MTYKYGIDYGTTNSSIAICRFDGTEMVPKVVQVEDTIPRFVTPSKVAFSNGEMKVGRSETRRSNPDTMVRKVKSLLEPKPEEYIVRQGKKIEVARLISAILRNLRLQAEIVADEYGIEISGVVLGVPVEYGDEQKYVLKKALVYAGYFQNIEEAEKNTEFVSEPLAVAVDYGENITENTTVAVFDFGGGTLDIAVVNLKKNIAMNLARTDKLHPHEVLAKVRGDIGGERLTEAFFINSFCSSNRYGTDYISKAFNLRTGMNPKELWDAIMSLGTEGDRFFEAIDDLKCTLSQKNRDVFKYSTVSTTFKQIYFERDDFERAIKKPIPGEIESTFSIIEKAVDDILKNDKIDGVAGIDEVLMAGGSSMIPCVQDYLYNKFPAQLNRNIPMMDLLTSIARGLSVIGCRENDVIEDVVDNAYGYRDVSNNCFVPVVNQGTKVKDTFFDRFSGRGAYASFVNNNPKAKSMKVEILQKNLHGESTLGTIELRSTNDSVYRLYMSIDKNQGILKCYFYNSTEGFFLDDTGDVKKEACEYKLKFN